MAITPNVTTSVAVTPNAVRYPAIILNSSIDPSGKLKNRAVISLQRSQKTTDNNGNSTWIDDPSAGSLKQKVIQDLDAYATANPTIGALIQTAWNAIDAVIAAINDAEKLV